VKRLRSSENVNDDLQTTMWLEQNSHWWYRARRELLASILSKTVFPHTGDNAHILEIGCGSGGNFDLFVERGTLVGIEVSALAIRLARTRAKKLGLESLLTRGSLPEALELPRLGQRFNVACAFDVLEHLDQDAATIRRVWSCLDFGGFFLITVPCHPWLFSEHDALLEHRRRYRKRDLITLLRSEGFEVIDCRWWLCLLFPALIATRLLYRVTQRGKAFKAVPDARPPRRTKSQVSGKLNSLLIWVMALERWIGRTVKFPIGGSLVIVARKIAPVPPLSQV